MQLPAMPSASQLSGPLGSGLSPPSNSNPEHAGGASMSGSFAVSPGLPPLGGAGSSGNSGSMALPSLSALVGMGGEVLYKQWHAGVTVLFAGARAHGSGP